MLAALLAAVSGCPTAPPPGGTLPPADTPAARLFVGTFDSSLAPDALNLYVVDAPADRALEIVAEPAGPFALGIGFAEAPDGDAFFSSPGATRQSADGRFRVSPHGGGGGHGAGLRFVGQPRDAGAWRFSIVADIDPAAIRNRLDRLNPLDAFLVNVWLTLGRPDLGPQIDALLARLTPELDEANGRIPTVLRVALIDPDDGDDSNGGGAPVSPAPTAFDLEQIVQTGDPVPGQSGATFTAFSNPLIDADGRVAFFAAYEGGDGDAGLYVFDDGQLTRVFDTSASGGAAPGGDPNDAFDGFDVDWDAGSPHLAWGNGGRLIFAAHLNGAQMPDALFRWRASDGSLLRLADARLLREQFDGATEDFLPEFYFPALSDTGIVHFGARYSYFDSDGGFNLFDTGVLTTNGVRLRPLLAEGLTSLAVPGRSGATFTDIALITSHNRPGRILLQAAYTGGGANAGNRGLYLWNGQALTRLFDNAPGAAPTGLPTGATVGPANGPLGAIALGERGQIAVATPLTAAGQTNNEVVYFNGTNWRRLTGQGGTRADALLSGVNRRGRVLVRAGGEPCIASDAGATRISAPLPPSLGTASLTWPAFGGAINNHNRGLVRFRRGAGNADGLLYWNGDRLLLVADLAAASPPDWDVLFPTADVPIDGELLRAGNIAGRPEIDRPAISGTLNDRDELTFRVGALGADGQPNTADDRQAIYVGRGTP